MGRILWAATGFLVAAVLTAGLAANAAAQDKKDGATKEQKKDEGKSDSKQSSFEYAKSLKLHVTYPPGWKADDKRAAIVFFSGGWDFTVPGLFKAHSDYLAGRGIVAIRADFRTKNANQAKAGDGVRDAANAISWIRKNAAKLGVDSGKIAAAGEYAGAHIAAAAYTTSNIDKSGKPNALILINPALDMEAHASRFADAKEAESMSPRHQLQGEKLITLPATLVIQGDKTPNITDEMGAIYGLRGRVSVLLAAGQPFTFYNHSPWKDTIQATFDAYLVSIGYLKGAGTAKFDKSTRLLTFADYMKNSQPGGGAGDPTGTPGVPNPAFKDPTTKSAVSPPVVFPPGVGPNKGKKKNTKSSMFPPGINQGNTPGNPFLPGGKFNPGNPGGGDVPGGFAPPPIGGGFKPAPPPGGVQPPPGGFPPGGLKPPKENPRGTVPGKPGVPGGAAPGNPGSPPPAFDPAGGNGSNKGLPPRPKKDF